MLVMHRVSARWLLAALAAAGAAGYAGLHAFSAVGQPPTRLADFQPARGDHYLGVAGCSSSSCHNGNDGRGEKGSEYTTWAGDDKHSQAFQVLYNKRSQYIVRNLFGDDAEPATKQTLCLKCHATSNGDPETTKYDTRFHFADGVGCESCHGPAERWGATHYQAGFKRKTVAEKAELGLWPTKDLAFRVKLCTSCHVGDASRGMEVNHDLIAAGHPRLNFEFAGFQGIYPKHWQEAKTKQEQPDLEARQWLLGQLMTARSAAEQLAVRAESAAKGGKDAKPWPEFAEYSCFACHKDLSVKPLEEQARPGHYAGSLPWGSWYLTMPEALARETKFDLKGSVQKVRELMERPSPDPGPIAKEAETLVKVLDGWIDKVQQQDRYSGNEVRGWFTGLTKDGAKRGPELSWDESAQLYLGLAALHQSLGDLKNRQPPEVKQDLLGLRNQLRQGFEKGFDSPRRFDRAAFVKALNGLREHLGN
jgi:hypothetical protein